ncbi:uncharacterized protein [Onthophagus taurus]|uniref:uncharacterized protein n=1 Tax=Onthophagus taurus TaxID=166361 RepID=UPI000C20B180|nr:D-arabinitol dehydrogenase 1-like [Onthophagus taurus]
MKAIRFDPVKKRVELVELEIPKIKGDDQVLIKVAYAGICGTDLHIIQGEFPCKSAPIVLGHEFSGIVIEVGTKVTNVKPGDQVVIDPNSGCQTCHNCHIGDPHFCEVGGLQNTIGIYRDGGWAEFCLVPDKQVFVVPSNTNLKIAALSEPISCLVHGLDKISPLPIGKEILITGAGIIGNLWLVALHLMGHRKVTVSEPNLHRLKQLNKLETGYLAITPSELEKSQKKYDIIIDCSGYGPAIEKNLTILNNGGKLCIFGVAPPNIKINVSPYEIFSKELTIIGVKINPFTFPKALGMLEALNERYLNYENLGIATFKLEEFERALEALKSGVISKATFKFDL